MNEGELTRRGMLTASVLAPLMINTSACAEPNAVPAARAAKPLVAFFSRSGNTRVIAGTLKRALQADLFEIQPARPYPEDYEETVEQARQERARNYEPPLAASRR